MSTVCEMPPVMPPLDLPPEEREAAWADFYARREEWKRTQGRPSITISELVTEAHATSREKGFWDPPKSVGEDIALMHSELSEALECYRSGDAPSAVYTCGGGGKLEGVPVELADVVIRIADFCGYHKIDLNRAIEEKLAYNRTRPHRHGGKAL